MNDEVPKITLSDGRQAIDCVAAVQQKKEAEAKGEILLLDDMSVGQKAIINTLNSAYKIQKLPKKGRFIIEGGTRFATPTEVTISGSTWGGSMLMMGRIGIDMHVEIWRDGNPASLVTSPVQSWSLIAE